MNGTLVLSNLSHSCNFFSFPFHSLNMQKQEQLPKSTPKRDGGWRSCCQGDFRIWCNRSSQWWWTKVSMHLHPPTEEFPEGKPGVGQKYALLTLLGMRKRASPFLGIHYWFHSHQHSFFILKSIHYTYILDILLCKLVPWFFLFKKMYLISNQSWTVPWLIQLAQLPPRVDDNTGLSGPSV